MALTWLLLALATGSAVFCALVVAAAWRYRRVRPPALTRPVPISILKPLAGMDEGLEDNLRSFFEQDYSEFELLFAVREAEDPSVAVAEKLMREYPGVPARLIVTGEPPYANAKVYSLELMLEAARHDLLVTSDSDTRVGPDLLQVIAAEFQDGKVGVATCPYLAVPGSDLWSRLEAIGMNTGMLSGVVVARMLEGMKFALGVVMTVRRQTVADIGGFARVKDYPADDFVFGYAAVEAGWRSILSSYVIEHRIGTQTMRASLAHRLRWIRAARRMRSAGYFGQLFTYPLPIALLLLAVRPEWWPAAGSVFAVRALAAWASARWILRDRLTLGWWLLLTIEDLVGFAFWIAGFFGRSVSWRGRRYLLNPDGTFVPAQDGRQSRTVPAGR